MKPLILIALFLPLTTQAQESWQGFKPLNEVPISANDYAYTSVVQIKTVGSVRKASDKPSKIIDITKISAFTEKELQSAGTPEIDEPNLKNIQIETCRKQGLRFCPIMKVASNFTGYFDQGKILNTCRHPYHNWLIWASQANDNRPINTISPPMVIYNGHKETVYNSALIETSAMLKFTMLNTNPVLNFIVGLDINKIKLSKKDAYARADFLRMQSTKEIVTPYTLNFSTDTSQYYPDETMYLIGYPGKTKLFKNGQGESPGNTLVVSSGNMMALNPNEGAVTTSNPAGPGMSGGMLVHRNGSVVGTACFITQEETPATLVFINDPAVVEKVWADIP